VSPGEVEAFPVSLGTAPGRAALGETLDLLAKLPEQPSLATKAVV
jgi:hypothetical protein